MRIVAVVTSVLLMASALLGSEDGALKGVVTDSSGAVISNVLVHVIRWGVDHNRATVIAEQRDVRTNARGEYSIELPPGLYDICFSSAAFSPFAKKVELKADKVVVLSPRMKYDHLAKSTD